MGPRVVAISMPLYVMDVLLSTVLRPNLPVQIEGIILMLFAAAYMGYAIRVDCGGANRSRWFPAKRHTQGNAALVDRCVLDVTKIERNRSRCRPGALT